MLRRLKIALAGLLLLALACDSDALVPVPLAAPEPQPVQTVITPTPLPATPAPALTPVLGGTLTIAAPAVASSLDVHREFSPSLAALGPGIVYSRLFRLRTGSSVTLPSLEVECELCSSWRLTRDTTLELFLRPDARWQGIPPVNGRPVTAQDVVASLERQRTPGWPNAAILQSVGPISAEWETVRLELKGPDADILLALADGHSKVLPVEALGPEGPSAAPSVGSGPWMLDATASPGRFTFAPNLGYFEEGLPYLNALHVLVMEDEGTRLAAFRLGALDVLEVPGFQWEAVQRQQPQLEHLRYPAPSTGVELAVRTTEAPFSDVRLRRALFLALDPWSLNREVWGDLAVVSSGAPVREPGWLLPEAEWRRGLNDPARAREVLAAADASGTPVEVTVADYGDPYLEYGRGIVEQLQSVSFDASMRVLAPREYTAQVWEVGRYAVSLAPPLPIGTPSAYLFGALHSNGAANRTGYTDAELDRLIEAQQGEWDPGLRREQALQIQRRLLERAVRFMPAAQVQVWAWWPRVQNLHLNVANYEYTFWSRVWVKAP